MTDNEPTTTGQPEPEHHIPGNKTTIQLDRETLAILNQCRGIEAQRRGTSWMKHNNFIHFLLCLYKKARKRDEGKLLLYLASKG